MAPGPRRADPTLASDAEREWVCSYLQEACVQGRLTSEELSARLDVALAARTRAELEGLLADLPPVPGAPLLPPAQKRVHVGILGATKRSGRWRVPAESWWTSVMGGCRLDLTNAVFDSPVTTINVMAGMGTIEIRVPKGFEIDLIGTAIIGGRHLRLEGPPPPAGAPVIRIRVISGLGKVKITDRETLRGRMRQY